MKKKIIAVILLTALLAGCSENKDNSSSSTTPLINTVTSVVPTASSPTESLIPTASTSEVTSTPTPTVTFNPSQGIMNLTGSLFALDTAAPAAVYSGFSAYSAFSTVADWMDGVGLEQTEAALGKIDNAAFDASKANYPIETGTMFLIDNDTQLNTDKTEGFTYADLQSPEIVPLVNDFVAEKTHNVIPTVLSEPFGDSAAAVIDTIYFKGEWQKPFSNLETSDDTFYGTDGENEVPFMHQTAEFGVNDTLKLFEMPYKDSSIVMDVMYDIDNPMTAFNTYCMTVNSELPLDYSRDILLSMPKFQSETFKNISDAYKNLGITDVFSEGSNCLSRLVSNVHIGSVIQKAKIIVDELGTEAAAVTVIDIKNDAVAMPKETLEINVNKPFFYALRDTNTNVILFAGYVNSL